jgi:hypothetical protein
MMMLFLSYVTVFPVIFTNGEVCKGTLDLKIVQVTGFKTGRYSQG